MANTQDERGWRVAVDTGGTFTDSVARADDGGWVQLKVASTPGDPSAAIQAALRRAGVAGPLRHGTTVATNALLERRVGRAVLITNAGFEDVLALRRQARPDLYALHPVVSPPIIPRARILGVETRRAADGALLRPLPDLDAWMDGHAGVLSTAEAFAICLLHGDRFGEEESALAAALRRRWPTVPVTAGHALSPVFREYERTSTVAVNAVLQPLMGRYLERLTAGLDDEVSVMTSAGGLLDPTRVAREPVRTVLSGPAGGVRGAWRAGQRCGRDALLAVDMGGTSTDVAVVRGALRAEIETQFGPHPLCTPCLPIETVGAGGGSIAWIDAAGGLRVGPRSAGAVPGPACYGRGGVEPTVTDAQVVLGRLDALLGGTMPLDQGAARGAIAALAARLGVAPEAAARGILAVAEATMARACKRVSLERGVDPQGLALVAFGGAGGLHACALADALGCPEVVFPAQPGLLSAVGILDAPREASAARSLHWGEADWRDAALAAAHRALVERLRAELPAGTRWQWLADCRYRGQTHALTVPLAAPPDAVGLRAAFDALHQDRYGYRFAPERPVELLALRYTLRAAERVPEATTEPAGPPVRGPTAVRAYGATLWLPAHWQAQPLETGDWRCTPWRAPDGEALDAGLATEVFRHQIGAIAEEMGATLMRAAFSANIKERRDFSCAIFDGAGQMLAHAAHIPVHTGSTPLSVRAAIEQVAMPPGTQVILNDPFCGGTHLPDVTLVAPVWLPGADAPSFYVANRAHHADIGGAAAGSLPAPRTLEGGLRRLTIDDEGVRITPTALDAATRARFTAASRTPDEREGDLRAQEAANRVGRARLVALTDALGAPRLAAFGAALLDYTEQRVRALFARLPDGRYDHVDHLDDDGTSDASIPLPLTLVITGDAALFDFSAAPPQVAGPLNAVSAITRSAVFYCVRCLAGADVPANAGLMRPITVLTRPGSVVDALPPAAVAAGNVETSQRLVDVVFGALSQAAPDTVPAASCGSMNNVLFGGVGPPPFVHYETLGGGAGAGPEGPGADGIHVHMTNTLNTPVEALEQAFPVRIERYALAPRAAHGGGRGVVRVWRFLAPAEVTVITERRRRPAPGATPRLAGTRGRNRLIRADGTVVELPGKLTFMVAVGDALEVCTPGGAGWS